MTHVRIFAAFTAPPHQVDIGEVGQRVVEAGNVGIMGRRRDEIILYQGV